MQFQIPGGGLSDPGTDGRHAETLMSCNPVTAIESPELSINLHELDRFMQAFLSDRSHQGFNLVLVKKALQRPANGSQRHRVHSHGRSC